MADLGGFLLLVVVVVIVVVVLVLVDLIRVDGSGDVCGRRKASEYERYE